MYREFYQLKEKGYIKSNIVKEGKIPIKAIYSLTIDEKKEFENSMLKNCF